MKYKQRYDSDIEFLCDPYMNDIGENATKLKIAVYNDVKSDSERDIETLKSPVNCRCDEERRMSSWLLRIRAGQNTVSLIGVPSTYRGIASTRVTSNDLPKRKSLADARAITGSTVI